MCVGDEGKKIDEVTMLSIITVFTLHAPPGVMCVQNILYPCINYCTQCFGNNNILVSIKFTNDMFVWLIQI